MKPEDHNLFKDDQSLREHLEAIQRHAEAAAQLCGSHMSTPIIKKNVPIVEMLKDPEIRIPQNVTIAKLPEYPEVRISQNVPIAQPSRHPDVYRPEDRLIVKLPDHPKIIVPVENIKNNLSINRNIAEAKKFIPTAIAGLEDFSKPPLVSRVCFKTITTP